jgi:catalytic LigB subunit of aromatic ring-opening dioxygenase
MGEVLGIGISHSPLFSRPKNDMAFLLSQRLADPAIPDSAKDQSKWPEAMKKEWSNDKGAAAGAAHHEAMLADFERARKVIDDFKPDFIFMWGDDQYENYKEGIIPPFSILAYDGDMTVKPWLQASASGSMKGKPNVWGEPMDFEFKLHFHREAAKYFVEHLLDEDFDISYSYQPNEHPGLAHAFLNACLYLDYHRKGFPHRIVPCSINCYGREVIGYRGFADNLGHKPPPDPHSPKPSRCFALGKAVAKIARESPYRVALMASSSWSHSFLTKKTWRMVPDIETDMKLYDAMVTGNYDAWKKMTLEEVEDCGGHETLNWFALMGAMQELNQKIVWSNILPTYIFNATKVTAVFGQR